MPGGPEHHVRERSLNRDPYLTLPADEPPRDVRLTLPIKLSGMPTTSDDRSRSAVRLALRVFEHGVPASTWLATPNPALGGGRPVWAAAESDEGLAHVACHLRSIAGREVARHQADSWCSPPREPVEPCGAGG